MNYLKRGEETKDAGHDIKVNMDMDTTIEASVVAEGGTSTQQRAPDLLKNAIQSHMMHQDSKYCSQHKPVQYLSSWYMQNRSSWYIAI